MPSNRNNKDGDYLLDMTSYIRKNMAKGYSKDSLKWALISQGHSKLEVEKAISQVDRENLAAEKKAAIKASQQVVESSSTQSIEPVVEEKKPFWKRVFGL